jgi:hypothetical protein
MSELSIAVVGGNEPGAWAHVVSHVRRAPQGCGAPAVKQSTHSLLGYCRSRCFDLLFHCIEVEARSAPHGGNSIAVIASFSTCC